MKKFQAPVIGGFRKMITLPNVPVGTTIAEVGSGTITLTQLAAAINNILQGSSSVTTGAGSTPANLVLGPGLAGGGTLVGNVPLRLTAPVPWGIMEDGADGDMGPPGPAGATGSTGPQGPAGSGGSGSSAGPVIWIPDDASYDDFLIPGPAGTAGAVGATGPQGPQGPAGSGSGGSGGMGTVMFMIHDDAPYEEVPLGFPPHNEVGPYLNVQGPFQIFGTGPSGSSNIYVATSSNSAILAFNNGNGAAVTATQATQLTLSQGNGGALVSVEMQAGAINFGVANVTRMTLQNGNPLLQLNGIAGDVTLGVIGGATAGVSALNVTIQGVQVGAPTGGTSGEMGNGTINVSKGFFINGVAAPTVAQSQAVSGAFMTHDDNYTDDTVCFIPPSNPAFQTGQFTFTATGMTTSPTGTGIYVIVGAMCTLYFPVITGTSNANSFTLTGLPTICQPARSIFVDVPGFVVENSTAFPSSGNLIQVTPGSNAVTFLLGGTTTGWGASGTKGVSSAFCVTYLLN